MAPHAVNWQIKQSVFGEASEILTDMIKLLKIVRTSGYSGYLPVETLGRRASRTIPSWWFRTSSNSCRP